MNDYQVEQLTAWSQVKAQLDRLEPSALSGLKSEIAGYLEFRRRVDTFLKQNFNHHCTLACYRNQRSVCCSKDGIIVFWADVVVNALCSDPEEMDKIATSIQHPLKTFKCIFLGHQGCQWRVRPLVCAMFLCPEVLHTVMDVAADLGSKWAAFQSEAKLFRWPDRPVLFDLLERYFIDRGCRSSLMYLNTSPGLLRIKQQAGLMGS
jgi:hypothetical protein